MERGAGFEKRLRDDGGIGREEPGSLFGFDRDEGVRWFVEKGVEG